MAGSTRRSSSTFSADETFGTRLDTGSPVSDQYAPPFEFAGALNKSEVDIAPTNFGALEQDRIRETFERLRRLKNRGRNRS